MTQKNQAAAGTGPDYLGIDKDVAVKKNFPVTVEKSFRVYFEPDAYHKMKTHANTTTEVELCGVLIGDVCVDNAGCYLTIDASIEGQKSNNYGTQVTFTHETWKYIHDRIDSEYPNKRIVGWYHTHPGFGIFLSGMDSFIQENFFNLPYQVAVVIETKAHTEGCFFWKDGQSVPMERYWVGKDEVRLTTGAVEAFDQVQAVAGDAGDALSEAPLVRGDTMASLMSYGTLFLVLILGFLAGLLMGGNSKQGLYRAFFTERESLVEYAAINAEAGLDLDVIRAEIEALSEDAGDLEEPLLTLRDEIAVIQAGYEKRSNELKPNIAATTREFENLIQRRDANDRDRLRAEARVTELIAERINKIIGKRPDKDVKPHEQRLIKQYLRRIIKRDPMVTKWLRKYQPGLVEHYLADEVKAESSFGTRVSDDRKAADDAPKADSKKDEGSVGRHAPDGGHKEGSASKVRPKSGSSEDDDL